MSDKTVIRNIHLDSDGVKINGEEFPFYLADVPQRVSFGAEDEPIAHVTLTLLVDSVTIDGSLDVYTDSINKRELFVQAP